MACLLQLECNFLHGYFRCWLPVVVINVEVKITYMQGMHIFQRFRATQLIKCTPWSTRLCPHPTIIKKMRTFLEVEGKMGLILQPACHQYRPPQLDTNPNVRKDKAMEKRKRQCPPNDSGLTQPPGLVKQPYTHPQQFWKPQSMPNPKQMLQKPLSLEDAPVCKSTPWLSAGKMSGNLFKDRNWLLPPNYLNNESKNAAGITSQNPQ